MQASPEVQINLADMVREAELRAIQLGEAILAVVPHPAATKFPTQLRWC